MKYKIIILLLIFYSTIAKSQDFSNKGTDFWITYPAHIDDLSSVMGIYITSDVNATGTITVNGKLILFSVAANGMTEKFIGSSAAADASNSYVYLSQLDDIKIGAAIHVISNNPVAVYSHIISSAKSGATLVLPTNVWGKEYIVPSYKSNGVATGQGYGTITVVAADTNTTIQIRTVVASADGNKPGLGFYTKILAMPGDVYQLQFKQGADISGTRVLSVSNGYGCKKIAVFSSTTWSAFGCSSIPGNVLTGDNLFQQLFPTGAWGKSFLTAPAKTRTSDIFRVFVSDPAAVVKKTEGGVTSTLTGLTNSSFYEFSTGNPTFIQSDKTASVVQYFTTMKCQSGATIGDPEMIVINPVEQTINNITVFSAHMNVINAKFPGQSMVNNCFLNIIIKSNSISSFKINNTLPSGTFTAIQGTDYSYLQEDVSLRSSTNPVQHLTADSNFIAIAYGFGNMESYGYNAGTNVIDLTQGIIVTNKYGVTNSPSTCRKDPFFIAAKFPYQPNSITCDFGNNTHLSPNATIGPILPSKPDSTFIDNISGKLIYVYKLGGPYTVDAAGSYPIKVTANNPTADGCSGVQFVNYDLQVFDVPKADFTFKYSTCLSDSIYFSDASNGNGRTINKWLWNYKDGTTDSVKNPVKKFAIAGIDSVQLLAINDIGCVSDTTKAVTIFAGSTAKFGINDSCMNAIISLTDLSDNTLGDIAKWYWDYGNGLKDTLIAGSTRQQTYPVSGQFNINLTIETNEGCRDIYSKSVFIQPLPIPGFTLPVICLPGGNGKFINTSHISDNSQNSFSYLWDFGDANDPSASTLQNPVHQFTALGPYTIKLKVTSKDGCMASINQSLTTIYPQPKSAFNAGTSDKICINDSLHFIDESVSLSSTVVKWAWNLPRGITSSLQNPYYQFVDSGAFTISLFIYDDLGCMSDITNRQITVYPYPKLIMGPDLEVKEKNTITIRPPYSYGNGLQFLWTPSTYLNSDNSPNPQVTPLEDQRYQLSLTGTGNCTIKDSINVIVLKTQWVSNAFSPNGDGINDTWSLKYLNNFPGNKVDVFNRNGQLVLHSIGYIKDWDGRYNNKPLPVGTYYYIISLGNGSPVLSGSVTIIR